MTACGDMRQSSKAHGLTCPLLWWGLHCPCVVCVYVCVYVCVCVCMCVCVLGCVTGYQVIRVIQIFAIRSNSNLALLGKID